MDMGFDEENVKDRDSYRGSRSSVLRHVKGALEEREGMREKGVDMWYSERRKRPWINRELRKRGGVKVTLRTTIPVIVKTRCQRSDQYH